MGKASGQRVSRDDAFAARLADALGPREKTWLARATGLAVSTVHDYFSGSIPRGVSLFLIADALEVSPRWLVTGEGEKVEPARQSTAPGAELFEASEADWIFVPHYDFAPVLMGAAVGPVSVNTYPLRRDWLNRNLGFESGLWVVDMPAADMASVAERGETIVCRNAISVEAGGVFLFARGPELLVRRVVMDAWSSNIALEADAPDAQRLDLSSMHHELRLLGRVLAKVSLVPIPTVTGTKRLRGVAEPDTPTG